MKKIMMVVGAILLISVSAHADGDGNTDQISQVDQTYRHERNVAIVEGTGMGLALRFRYKRGAMKESDILREKLPDQTSRLFVQQKTYDRAESAKDQAKRELDSLESDRKFFLVTKAKRAEIEAKIPAAKTRYEETLRTFELEESKLKDAKTALNVGKTELISVDEAAASALKTASVFKIVGGITSALLTFDMTMKTLDVLFFKEKPAVYSTGNNATSKDLREQGLLSDNRRSDRRRSVAGTAGGGDQ